MIQKSGQRFSEKIMLRKYGIRQFDKRATDPY
jgi:hypothetical protein